MTHRFSNAIGIDDAPFDRAHRGEVAIVGVVFTRGRLDGVMTGTLGRDGDDASEAMATMIAGTTFLEHAQILLLGGITFGGFNVVDLSGLHARLGLPVLIMARREPRYDAIREALLTKVPGGARKWALIEAAGEMQPCAGLWVQRAGLDLDDAARAITDLTIHGKLPEPIRVAHLIAGAFVDGVSRGRA